MKATVDDNDNCLTCKHDHRVESRDVSYGDWTAASPGHEDFCDCTIEQVYADEVPVLSGVCESGAHEECRMSECQCGCHYEDGV